MGESEPVLTLVKPKRVAVDETAVKINGEMYWLYAAIYLESKLILDAELVGRHGTDPAAAFLHRLAEKHDLSDYPQKPWVSGVPTRRIRLVDAVFLVDGFGYQIALARLGLRGRRDYTDRNLIEKWFQTLKQRIDRFSHSWVGSRRSVRQRIEQFVHYYNHQRPHQSLDNRTPVEEVLN